MLRSILSKMDTHQNSVNFLFAYNPWDCGCDRIKSMQVSRVDRWHIFKPNIPIWVNF
jgi:hypothetical protein